MRPLSRWVEKRLIPGAIRLADRIVVYSESTLKGLENEYPDARQRIRVVYPGVTDLPLAQGPEALVSMGIIRPYFLFIGTLELRKNFRRLLNAYALVDDSIKCQYHLVIAGGKDWSGLDIHQLISNAELEKQVVVTGYVDESELATLYANALFLVIPSLYEGFGLPILEAMTYGIPALISNNFSMPEVAGDAGMVVDPFDEMSISAGLSSFLGNEKEVCWQAAQLRMQGASVGRMPQYSLEQGLKATIEYYMGEQ